MQISISEDGVIMLHDEEGEFLTIDEPYECTGSMESDEEGALTGLWDTDKDNKREDATLTLPATNQDIEILQRHLEAANHYNAKLEADLNTVREQLEAQTEREAKLTIQLSEEKQRQKQMWSLSCQQLAENDELVAKKEMEIQRLKEELSRVTESAGRNASPSSVKQTKPIVRFGQTQVFASGRLSDEEDKTTGQTQGDEVEHHHWNRFLGRIMMVLWTTGFRDCSV